MAAALQVTAEAGILRIGSRHRAVPLHGYVPVVVRDRRRADLAAISNDGSVPQTAGLRRSDLSGELRQRVPEGWLFKIKER